MPLPKFPSHCCSPMRSYRPSLQPHKVVWVLQSQWNNPLSSRYVFNKPVDGHALAIFGVKLDSRRIPIQSSLQRVEVTKSGPLPASPPPTLFYLPKKPYPFLSLVPSADLYRQGSCFPSEGHTDGRIPRLRRRLHWGLNLCQCHRVLLRCHLYPSPWLRSGHCVLSQPIHSVHVTLGHLLPQFPHQRNGKTSAGLAGAEIVLLSFPIFTKMGFPYPSTPHSSSANLLFLQGVRGSRPRPRG